jgi:hypothetical protein
MLLPSRVLVSEMDPDCVVCCRSTHVYSLDGLVTNGCGQLMMPLVTPGDEARRYRDGKLHNRKNEAEYTFVIKEKMRKLDYTGKLVFIENQQGEPVFVQCAWGNSVFFKQHKHGPHRNWELRDEYARKQRQTLLETTAKWNKEATKEMEATAKLEAEMMKRALETGESLAGLEAPKPPEPKKKNKKKRPRALAMPPQEHFMAHFSLADSVPADVRKAAIINEARASRTKTTAQIQMAGELSRRPRTPPPTTRPGKLKLALQVKLRRLLGGSAKTKTVQIQVLDSPSSKDGAPVVLRAQKPPKMLRADAGMGGAHAGGIGFRGKVVKKDLLGPRVPGPHDAGGRDS